MADCGCRYRYVNGENERVWLATQNSDLRSDLRRARQEIELLNERLDDMRMLAEQDACEIERLRTKLGISDTHGRDWVDTSSATYTTESTTVDGYVVTVCLDDEGPLRPAFFWLIEKAGTRVAEGWEPSVADARTTSLRHAARLSEVDRG